MIRRSRCLAFVACALALTACASTQPSQPVTITLLPGTPAPIATPGPTTTLGAATAEIELTITGGPAEGSYRAVVNGPSCSQPSPDAFVADYANSTAVDGFTALELNVRDAAAAIDDQTDDFALSLTVAGTTLRVDPKASEGDGEALLEIDQLANATLDLSATAADGSDIEISLLCDVEPL
jgi:hypothetical protein